MSKERWHERWASQKTPWDAGQSPPILKQLVEANELPTGSALVPGCGSGYDVITLAGPKRRVLGIDLVPEAIERFDELREAANIPASFAHAQVADFFDFKPPQPFTLIWDYTFLCAIPPELREAWVQRCKKLLSPKGQLWTLIFPVNGADPTQGPPFPMDPQVVRQWMEPTFQCLRLERVKSSLGPRQGKEWLGVWQPKA